MTIEQILFGLFALLAVISAAFMVISPTRNAVHSALALVVTMASLAFLFLMLDAPFLAMIQITVYAGAIMVLFIFVIMLLGAEKLDVRETKFSWFFGVGATLVIALAASIFIPFLLINVEATEPPSADPRVRVVHAATDVPAVEIALNSDVIASGLEFLHASGYVDVPAGDYSVTVTPEGGAPITTSVSLAAGTAQTVIAYGVGSTISFAVVADDLSTIGEARSSRLMAFNAWQPDAPVSIVDFGSEFDPNDTTTLVGELAYGTASSPMIVEEGSYAWSFISGVDVPEVDGESVVAQMGDFDLERDQSQLIILAAERQFDETLRATVAPFGVEARAAFGSPRAIGTLLFIDYMLPFQLLAVLLLASMVGAIVLTRHHVVPTKQRDNVRRKVSRPLTNVIASQVGHEVAQSDTPQLPAETDQREPAGD